MISFSSSLKHSLDKKNLILMREKLRNQKKKKITVFVGLKKCFGADK